MHTGGYIYSEVIKRNEMKCVAASLQPPPSRESAEATEVREEKQQQEEEQKEAEMEERERVNALLQRKKLLQDLGVVDQLHQLLQGPTGGGRVPQDAKDGGTQQQSQQAHQRPQPMKVTTKNCSAVQHSSSSLVFK